MRCHRRQNGGCALMQKVPLEGGLVCVVKMLPILLLIVNLQLVDSVLPRYVPSLRFNVGQRSRNDLIEDYFNLGYTYPEIVAFLCLTHGIVISLRQVKRIIRHKGLQRRRQSSGIVEVVDAIEEELTGSGSCVGYRQMHQRLRNDHKLVVTRETTRIVLGVLDPEGVSNRRRGRLQRRRYRCKGPNYLWHIDGYDKVKPYGFCIHGAIDGYSRRILWLEVTSTNNDPAIVAKYYVDCVHQLGGAPRIVRADCGTENVVVAGLQRIEAWWSFLRKSNSNWWINYFKDLRDAGIFRADDPLQVACLQFCYTTLLEKELYRVARHWNTHRMRPYPNQETPSGKPDMLFFLPELTDSHDYQTVVEQDDLDIAEDNFCKERSPFGCREEFSDLILLIMEENSLSMPGNADEALQLYVTVLSELQLIF